MNLSKRNLKIKDILASLVRALINYKYSLLIALVLAIISIFLNSYSSQNCAQISGNALFVNCPGILGWLVSIFSIIPLIAEGITLLVVLHPPVFLDWIISFLIYFGLVVLVYWLVNKFRKN